MVSRLHWDHLRIKTYFVLSRLEMHIITEGAANDIFFFVFVLRKLFKYVYKWLPFS